MLAKLNQDAPLFTSFYWHPGQSLLDTRFDNTSPSPRWPCQSNADGSGPHSMRLSQTCRCLFISRGEKHALSLQIGCGMALTNDPVREQQSHLA